MLLKKIFLSSLISLTIISNQVWAEDSVFLNKDDKAPYSGYLLPKEKVLELRNNTLERDTLKLQNDSLNRSVTRQDGIIAKKDQQLTLYGDQMDKMAQVAYSAQSLNNWEKVGYVALGIIITGLAIKGAHDLYK